MHFWIDKSRFGGHPCAFNGANRHRPLGGGRSWRSTKPNVVPVHRFTSVESTSSPPQHTLHPHPNLTLSTGNQRPSACSRVINMDDDTDEDNIHIGPVYIHNMAYTGSTGQNFGCGAVVFEFNI
ncbi:hypothetical protein M8J75_012560 [Diaphorina citri]|nr:hypothetical protein M8J75_012560 [Diaphorina citri]